MDVDQLRRELREKEFRPVYLLCGAETLLIEEALRALVETLLAPEERDLGVVRLYADQAEVEEVLGEARTMPLFGSRRLVVVRRVEAWRGLFSARRRAASQEEPGREDTGDEPGARDQLDARRQSLLGYLEDPNTSTHLIFVGGMVDGRLPLVRRLRAMGALVECKAYTQETAIRWTRERAAEIGCSLSREGAALLVEHVGTDLQRLAREVEKLAEYGADGTELTAEAIERLVAGTRGRSAFELTDAIARQDVETALRRLEALLTVGEGDGGPLPPLRILGTLAWQVRRVWLVKDGDRKGLSDRESYNRTVKNPVKGLSEWHQRQLQEIRATAGRFSEADMARALRRLLQADSELKGEGTSERRALETLVMDLCAAGEAKREGG
ncbi:MAG: DNA polymerase III subunit delta [bacterium]|nr:DNA polymerase III subunit delta [bacterium]